MTLGFAVCDTSHMKAIAKSTIVKFNGGFYRVTAVIAGTVNLGAVFGGKIYHKRIPVAQVAEAEKEFHAAWSQSESYRCM